MLTITEKQRNNLHQLARVLRALPEDAATFDMSTFAEHPDSEFGGRVYSLRQVFDIVRTGNAHPCGTVGCALGQGAFHGIGNDEVFDDNWDDYSRTVFGIDSNPDEGSDLEWGWVFDACWAWTAYSGPLHAAKRIEFLLKEGAVPPWFTEMDGDADQLCDIDVIEELE